MNPDCLKSFTETELLAEIQRRQEAALPQPIENPDWSVVKHLMPDSCS